MGFSFSGGFKRSDKIELVGGVETAGHSVALLLAPSILWTNLLEILPSGDEASNQLKLGTFVCCLAKCLRHHHTSLSNTPYSTNGTTVPPPQVWRSIRFTAHTTLSIKAEWGATSSHCVDRCHGDARSIHEQGRRAGQCF